MTESEALELCVDLALEGWGRVAPNPMAGAVLLRSGEVVGTGYHAEFGGAHAEIAALAACDDPVGTTCVVSLEPCDHQGKTPPCTEALLGAGVSRVVFGSRDPGKQSSGGAERLRSGGVDVELVESSRARWLNSPFFFRHARDERPFVALKLATSADGFIAGTRERQYWISGSAAREYVHWLRAGFDAIGVGRHTAETDDPSLTVRGATRPRVKPARLIFSRSGRVRGDLGLLKTTADAPTGVVVVGGQVPEGGYGDDVSIVAAADLAGALRQLRAGGCNSILIEGGGDFATALLNEGLVDRVYWIQAPLFLRDGVPGFGTGPGAEVEDVERWRVVERRELDEDTLLVMERGACLPEL